MKASFKNLKTKNNINYMIVVVAWLLMFILDSTGNLKNGTQAIIVTVGINIVLAVSLNLLVGFLGELTLGHAGFMCVGAFIGKYISMNMTSVPTALSFTLALLVGGCIAAVFGLIIGLPTMRLRGDYLAIVTLAFGEIVRNIILNMPMFGGALGLNANTKVTNYTIVCVAVLVTIVVIQNLVNSRHGRAIRAIRDNDIAARSVGISVTYYKLAAFVVAAFFAGIAGVLYSHSVTSLSSSAFSYNYSIEILVFVVLGGMGSIRGSMIAAAIITYIPIAFGFLQDYRLLIYSIVLILMMLANASPKFQAVYSKYQKIVKDFMFDIWFKISHKLKKDEGEDE